MHTMLVCVHIHRRVRRTDPSGRERRPMVWEQDSGFWSLIAPWLGVLTLVVLLGALVGLAHHSRGPKGL